MSAPQVIYACIRLSATQRAVIDGLRANPIITMPCLATLVGISERHAVRVCHTLRDQGIVHIDQCRGGLGKHNGFFVTAQVDDQGAWVFQHPVLEKVNPDINPDILPLNPDINPDILTLNPDINPDMVRANPAVVSTRDKLLAMAAHPRLANVLPKAVEVLDFHRDAANRKAALRAKVQPWVDLVVHYTAIEHDLVATGQQSLPDHARAGALALRDARARGIDLNLTKDQLVSFTTRLATLGDDPYAKPDRSKTPDPVSRKQSGYTAHTGEVVTPPARACATLADEINLALSTRFPAATLLPILAPFADTPDLVDRCQRAKSAASASKTAFSVSYLARFLSTTTVAVSA